MLRRIIIIDPQQLGNPRFKKNVQNDKQQENTTPANPLGND